MTEIRVPYLGLQAELQRVLRKRSFPPERAELIARLFAENQRDGIYSHGLHRFSGFLTSVSDGRVDPEATPEKESELGAVERWDGRRGAGLWNAWFAMGRAVELARAHGIGCVGLRRTNHWMRAGTYALRAAEAGCIGLCWTNTVPLMPPWGAAEPKIGNNPLAIAVPRRDGPVLLDMAMSQYSFGKLEIFRRAGDVLPLDGGFDSEGKLTRDPAAILATRRPLPIGYWKGSGLAVVLDMMTTIVSGGLSTAELGRESVEFGVSQTFIAINAVAMCGETRMEEIVTDIIASLHAARPLSSANPVRFPGERMLRIRQESLERGVLVDAAHLAELRAL